MTFLPEISRVQSLESKVDKLERRVAELTQESARLHSLLMQLAGSTASLSESMIELGHRTMGSMPIGKPSNDTNPLSEPL